MSAMTCICPDYPTAVHANCPAHPNAVEHMLKGLAGVATAVADQAQAMTDAELGALLLMGRWTTLEVHEAGRRLQARVPSSAGSSPSVTSERAPEPKSIEVGDSVAHGSGWTGKVISIKHDDDGGMGQGPLVTVRPLTPKPKFYGADDSRPVGDEWEGWAPIEVTYDELVRL